MLSPTNSATTVPPRTYAVPQDVLDNMLIHQKDKILAWLTEMETTKDRDQFCRMHQRVLGCLVVLADMWAAFGYHYKSEEISKKIGRIRTEHEFGYLLK